MQYKNILLGIAVLFLIIFIAPQVHAAACSGAPVEDCTVAAAATYQMPYGQVYVLNDTNSNGAVRATGAGATIDCNFSSISGTFANSSGTWPFAGTADNITLKNCNVTGGFKGVMKFDLSNKVGFVMQNMKITGNFTGALNQENGWTRWTVKDSYIDRTGTTNQVCFRDYGGSGINNVTMTNNTFIGCGGVLQALGDIITFQNNIIYTNGSYGIVTNSGGDDSVISGNTINGQGYNLATYLFNAENRDNMQFLNNVMNFTNYTLSSAGAIRLKNSTNIIYAGNVHNGIGIYLPTQYFYALFENNTFYNVTANAVFSDYGSGSANMKFNNNTLINYLKTTDGAGHYTVYSSMFSFSGTTVLNLTITNNRAYKATNIVAGTQYTNCTITGNYINDSGTQGYAINLDSGASPYNRYSSGNTICYNNINYGGHDALVVNGYDNIICYNNITEATHHHIELATAYEVMTPYITGGRNNIYGNILIDTDHDDVDFNSLPICYFALSGIQNNFYNNTCIGSNMMTGYGNNSYGNNNTGNTINTTHVNFTTAMTAASIGHNGTLQQNTFILNYYNGLDLSSGGAHITVLRNNSMPSMFATIRNNTYSIKSGGDNFVTIYDGNYLANATFTIDEPNMPPLVLNLHGSYFINQSGTGKKYLTYSTNGGILNLTNYSQAYPNNDVKNGSTIISRDTNNLGFAMSNPVTIGDFNCNKHYKDSGQSYSCNATACYFTNTNCTEKNARTS